VRKSAISDGSAIGVVDEVDDFLLSPPTRARVPSARALGFMICGKKGF
jgi:hypothetical protein